MEWKFSSGTAKMESSTIREILALMSKKDMISFAGGMPAEEFFPYNEMNACWERTMEANGRKALQYSQTEGVPELRETLAGFLGGGTGAGNVLVTTGSQQALYLLGRIMIDEGDPVVVERPTYLGALQSWRHLGPQLVAVPMDGKGMSLEELARLTPGDVRFIYVVPTYHNPAGESMPEDRRLALVELAREKGAFIVEDDPYSLLRYEGPEYTPIRHIAPDITISLGTFSKMMCPGMRTAWVSAPEPVITMLSKAKQAVDLCTPALNQYLAHEFIRGGFVEKHTARMCPVYDARRRFMMERLDAILPEGASYVRPQGGMFLWVRLPEGWDGKELLRIAMDKGVAFVPGRSFFVGGEGPPAMRLNFSKEPEDKVRRGMALLKEAMDEYASTL